MNRLSTTRNLIRGDSNPLCAADRNLIMAAYVRGDKLTDISRAVGRSLGTVQTVVRALRIAGLVQYRYAGCADARP